jgi:hypothetical protein
VEGTVVAVDESTMSVRAEDGSEVIVEGQPWRFALEQGFQAEPGDRLTLTGFPEDGEFKVGRIDDDTTGETVVLRDETGRPGWSGQGRRQGAGAGH